ncbi:MULTISPECIES: intermembrane transport protein PqiB [unclassified Methylophaga]|uniref:intermembrane transport protein PqiB n=1 Tax=unclassified Methylophaga TaxID=2629249 RepID=UPI000C3A07BD|nr:intermembrane transport protein PqiB [Methylophaga sp. UBA678]MAX53656.1 mammalian cell entry protein [Methylophaga sp.]|tara:strand:- start:61284 stop:62954 length:1671 start_codon:yes stop_codon:yes gene_type:complete
MTDDVSNTDTTEELDNARATKASSWSPIWILPIVAVLIGAWLVVDDYLSTGPLINLTMNDAEGIAANKTLIKTRNVEIGHVESVTLSEDLQYAVVKARINPDAASTLVEDTRFWVVKPRIGREGISGLNTVLSGAYIQLEPGQSQQEQREFEVLDQPPVSLSGNGIHIKLDSPLGISLKPGDPVSYEGQIVGRVEKSEFKPGNQHMHHELFIEAPYDVLVTKSTRFWSSSGVNISLDSKGFNINLASLETLLSSGVSFGVLQEVENDEPAASGDEFALYSNQTEAQQASYDRYIEYVLMVKDTVRGLAEGAPVEFRGLRIGTVESVPWEYNSRMRNGKDGFAIPVLIRLEPQRLGDFHDGLLEEWKQRVDRLIERGLVATLKPGNLLTGAMFVDINIDRTPGMPEIKVAMFKDRQVIPTKSSQLAQMEMKISNLLDKLNGLEVQPVLDGVNANLKTSQALLQEVQTLASSIDQFVNNPQTQTIPDNVNQTLAELRETLKGLSPEAPAYQNLSQSIKSLEGLIKDIQPLVRTLNEQPNALIFNRTEQADPQPPAAQP